MSMTRDAAIQHFSAQKYASMSIAEALRAAPRAVHNGLASQDRDWIARFGEVPARDAVARLVRRGHANPDGL